MFNYIDTHIDQNVITYDDLSDYVYSFLHKDISKEPLRHVANLNFSEHFKSVVGLPMDSKRIDPSEIDSNYFEIEKNIQNVHLYFIFNIEEVGVQDFQDAQQQYVLER